MMGTRSVLVLLILAPSVSSSFIDGCPLFGCRPSGSFSFYLDVPRANATINWIAQSLHDPVPKALGCVADSVSVICPSNGVFSDEKGYMSLYRGNGTVRWRDRVLHYPTLPILDNNGDVTGTDGVNLVHYGSDGTGYPVIPCEGLQPVFSIQLVGSMFLLLVSESGGIVVRATNGIPVGELFLNSTVQRANGTFIPISQPVVNGNRFYLLTEFVPEIDTYVDNLQRLYAIDVHGTITNRITIAWCFDFEMESKDKTNRNGHKQRDNVRYSRKAHLQRLKESNVVAKQNLLWSENNKTVYVILPAPYYSKSNMATSFWALEDTTDSTKLSFRSGLIVTHMTIFESDDDDKNKRSLPKVNPVLWVVLDNSKLCSIMANASISRTIDLKAILKMSVSVTSKVATIRNDNADKDVLVFGIKLQESMSKSFREILAQTSRIPIVSNATSYVVAIDTRSEPAFPLWLVPVPENMIPKGQLVGSSGTNERMKDQLVIYAENDEKSSAKIFSIH